MSDRDITSWDQRLKDQVMRQWINYQVIRIDLSTARVGTQYNISSEYLYIARASNKSAIANIAFNRITNDQFTLETGSKFKTVFENFYIWNAQQSGAWIDLVVGINFEYYRTDEQGDAEAQACIILTKVAPGNAVAAAHPCNRVLIRAHTGNAGTVWIDFGVAAVVGACYELTAGDAISVPCSNTGRINGNFTAGGDDVTIVYEA